jgi:hypothetical protein
VNPITPTTRRAPTKSIIKPIACSFSLSLSKQLLLKNIRIKPNRRTKANIIAF